MKKQVAIILLVALFTSFFSSSAFSKNNPKEILSNRALCLKPGDSFTVKVETQERTEGAKNIYWGSSDPTIVSLDNTSQSSVNIKALRLGQCDVYLFRDQRQLASCRVIVDNDGVVKILAIGNSFSEDAIEQNLYEILKAEGIEVIIGNMYIGGCSIDHHWKNASTDEAAYSYRKIVNGKKITTENYKISQAIDDENWDYISFQQASHFSGIKSTYADLPLLVQYVKDHNKNPQTHYVLHQTWAYANNSQHDGFRNYNHDQKTMYRNIVSAISNASKLVGIETVIPVGTAIQNGRTSFVGDNYCRDGYHLDLQLGRYTASCTWADKLLGLNIISNPFIPQQLTFDEIMVARLSAHHAVCKPNKVTKF